MGDVIKNTKTLIFLTSGFLSGPSARFQPGIWAVEFKLGLKMRHYFLLVILLLAGCMPLQQIDWESSISEIRIAPQRKVLYISILTSTTDRTKQPSIEVFRSYAVHNGQRYKIQSKKNSYVSPGESPWTMEVVNLAPESADATQQLEWENGKWELHLEFKGITQRDPIDAKFSLRTFWYSPLIHGMPN